jgi:type II secretory pathway predicted ATPase ExeA
MCERCADRARVITLLHGHHTGGEVLRQVLRELMVPIRRTDDHARLLELLRERLLCHANDARAIVLLADEAQTLSDRALEELRLLSNFDTSTRKLVQVVLVGQPELRQRIRNPRFDALRQRIVMAKQLQPLSLEDTADYINHRLRMASADPANVGAAFPAASVREIHRSTGGVPRLVNVACDNCLLLAMVRETREVVPAMVSQVMADMLPRFDEPRIVVTPERSLSLVGSH